ncbi:MAG: zinc-ribbon domain-containing protein [Methanobacteriaceae archaeon]
MVFCIHCGKENEEDSEFCKHCGKNISNSDKKGKKDVDDVKKVINQTNQKLKPNIVDLLAIVIFILLIVLFWWNGFAILFALGYALCIGRILVSK